ncbi:MAG: transporter substrate-binding domain-containing protein [Wenzhouxiangellaceae bacterium]|nr:transporter substrate-binding domain-containing protein [Wenzhouxiangellaceae bacterium]
MMKTRVCLLAVLGLVVTMLCGCQPNDEPGAENAEKSAEAQQTPPETATVESECQLDVGWDPWEPYHYLAAGGQLQGLDIELIRLAAESAGCDLEFIQGSWHGLLRLLRAGELDVMMGATRIPGREEFAIFSEPYRSETFQLYALDSEAEKYRDQTLSQLMNDGFRLGVTAGYYYGDAVSDLLENPEFDDQIFEAAVGELNFTRLLDLQIDGFLEDAFVAAAIARRRLESDRVVALPREVSSGPVTFMFSRASVDPAIVERFDEALARLRESGRHQQLLDRYLE